MAGFGLFPGPGELAVIRVQCSIVPAPTSTEPCLPGAGVDPGDGLPVAVLKAVAGLTLGDGSGRCDDAE